MPDESRPHDESVTPPPESVPEPTRELPADETVPAASAASETPPRAEQPEPGQPGKAARFFGHRATLAVAAGIAGLLIGGGTTAAIMADDDRDERGFHMTVRGDDGREFRDDAPWMDRGPHAQMKPRNFERFLPKLRNYFPEHHHDKDGNVVPGKPEK